MQNPTVSTSLPTTVSAALSDPSTVCHIGRSTSPLALRTNSHYPCPVVIETQRGYTVVLFRSEGKENPAINDEKHRIQMLPVHPFLLLFSGSVHPSHGKTARTETSSPLCRW